MSKTFSASNEMIMFFLQLVYMVDHTDRFLYIEPSLNLWDEAYQIKVGDFLYVFLDSLCEYFFKMGSHYEVLAGL